MHSTGWYNHNVFWKSITLTELTVFWYYFVRLFYVDEHRLKDKYRHLTTIQQSSVSALSETKREAFCILICIKKVHKSVTRMLESLYRLATRQHTFSVISVLFISPQIIILNFVDTFLLVEWLNQKLMYFNIEIRCRCDKLQFANI